MFTDIKNADFYNFCFGATLASDNVVRIESINNFDEGGSEEWCHNREHVQMFRAFHDLHSKWSHRDQNTFEEIRALRRAEEWEFLLGDHSEDPISVYERIEPTLNQIFPRDCRSTEQEKPHTPSSWNPRGDKMTWNFIDMALCWGRIHHKKPVNLIKEPEKSNSLVHDVITKFEREGFNILPDGMPILPSTSLP